MRDRTCRRNRPLHGAKLRTSASSMFEICVRSRRQPHRPARDASVSIRADEGRGSRRPVSWSINWN